MSTYQRFVYVEGAENFDAHVLDEADGKEYYDFKELCDLLNDKQDLTDYFLKELEYNTRMHNKFRREVEPLQKEVNIWKERAFKSCIFEERFVDLIGKLGESIFDARKEINPNTYAYKSLDVIYNNLKELREVVDDVLKEYW